MLPFCTNTYCIVLYICILFWVKDRHSLHPQKRIVFLKMMINHNVNVLKWPIHVFMSYMFSLIFIPHYLSIYVYDRNMWINKILMSECIMLTFLHSSTRNHLEKFCMCWQTYNIYWKRLNIICNHLDLDFFWQTGHNGRLMRCLVTQHRNYSNEGISLIHWFFVLG